MSPSDASPPAVHARPVAELFAELSTDPDRGLTTSEAAQRLASHGPNRLAEAPPIPLWRKLLDEFKDLVIWILIVAAIISGLLGEWIDSVAIVAIVLINGLIGFFQKRSAERAIAALMEMSAPMARVLDGLIAGVAGDRTCTPSVAGIAFERQADVREDDSDEELWERCIADLSRINEERSARQLMPAAFARVVDSRVGQVGEGGELDHVLRVPLHRSLAVATSAANLRT